MKLTKLILGGFKGINEQAELPIAPITLLFGANSSGKSTVLQGLLYLYEILNHRNLDPDFSHLTGDKVYLGGYSYLVHGKLNSKIKRAQEITIGAEVEIGETDLQDNYLNELEEFALGHELDATPDMLSQKWKFVFKIGWNTLDNRPYVRQFDAWSENQHFLRIEAQPGTKGGRITHLEILDHWELVESIESIAELLDKENWQDIPLANTVDGYPNIDKRLDLSGAPWDWNYVNEEHPSVAKIFCEGALSQGILSPFKLLRDKLKKMLHLGPLRIIPGKGFFVRQPNQTAPARWYDGTGAWDSFYHGSAELRDSVNAWFNQVKGFDSDYRFSKDGDSICITDTANDITLMPGQVGIGVAQVFPFVVGTCLPKSPVLSIEQPELHIHPRWQLALADMMLDAVNSDPDRMFLVETHSEHLMLRLLKRRRQTVDEELESDAYRTHRHTAQIIFCEQSKGRTRLKPIGITDEGEFDAPWPNGFFNERTGELF